MSEFVYDYFGIADVQEDPSILSVFSQDNYLAVRISLPSTTQPQSPSPSLSSRPKTQPIHLGLLIDVSESMAEGRLAAVKRTLHAARSAFQPQDSVTLVVFGDIGKAIVVNHRMDEAGKDVFYKELDDIATAGCTNMSSGLEILNAVQSRNNPYDAVIVLTDGEVNRGIESTEGLTAMAHTIGNGKGLTFHMLGYGANHNRILLRVLATQTCGVYQYIQSDEQVSSSFGDSIGNTRAVELRNVSLQLPAGWKCMEVSPAIGDVVPGREIWAVYRRDSDASPASSPVRLTGWKKSGLSVSIQATKMTPTEDSSMVLMQILRARVSHALSELSNILESNRVIRRRTIHHRMDGARNALTLLQEELQALSSNPDIRVKPLFLHMKAQIAEALASNESDEMDDSLARLSSAAAGMCTQRAVDADLFTSPAGRDSAQRVHTQYSS